MLGEIIFASAGHSSFPRVRLQPWSRSFPPRLVGRRRCEPAAGITAKARKDHPARINIHFSRLLVGAARFELTTPCLPDKCANRAALRPDRNGADYRDAPMAAQHRIASPAN